MFIRSRPENLALQGRDNQRPLEYHFRQAPVFGPEKLIRYAQRINLWPLVITSILIFLCFISNLAAQERQEDCQQRIDATLRYIPSRSAKAMSGKIEIIESESEYSYEFKVFDKFPVKFSVAPQYIGIENTTEVELPAHLTGLTTDIETTLPFFNFDKTYLRLGISPSFYGEDWDFQTSNFRIPMRYFLIHQPNDQWTFIGGVAVYPDFENEILPILGFIYRPNDRLVFNIIPKKPNISYIVNNRVTLFAEGGSSSNSEFEVTKDNLKNVVLRYKQMRLGSGIKFKLNKFIQSSISAGAVFNRTLKYRDSLGKVNLKDGFYTEFRIEMGL